VSAGGRPAPTRQNLLALERRLHHVAKGTALLRRKREALVAELFRLARPAVSARASIAACSEKAYPLLLAALSLEGAEGLMSVGRPGREVRVEMRSAQVWGIAVAEILGRPPIRRTPHARGVPPAAVSGATTEATTAFEELTELLLDAANRETLLGHLGEALARTSRQVNTLERRLQPALSADLVAVRRTLDEREREDHVRLERLMRSRSASW
jgi:V/A-type H+/Na+-transporting ATPase subunit D